MDKETQFALYKGEDLIVTGTVHEIAEATNTTVQYIRYIKTPSYQRRCKGKNGRKLVEMEDESLVLISEKKRAQHYLVSKLKRHLANRKPKVTPLGNFERIKTGFMVRGTRVINGREQNKLYYSDDNTFSVWGGPKRGWLILEEKKKEEKKETEIIKSRDCYKTGRKMYPFKANYQGVTKIYENANTCADAFNIDVTYIYQMARNGKRYKGISFEKLPLEE